MGLAVKGESVFESERRALECMTRQNGNQGKTVFWMQNHILNEDLEVALKEAHSVVQQFLNS